MADGTSDETAGIISGSSAYVLCDGVQCSGNSADSGRYGVCCEKENGAGKRQASGAGREGRCGSMELKQLKDAVEAITLPEDAKERILDMQGRQAKRRRQKIRVYKRMAAVCAGILIVMCMLFFPAADSRSEWSVTAYAQGSEGAEWVRLRPGERVLLQSAPDQYAYTLELDLPQYYYYEKEGVILGQDHIWVNGETIYWIPEHSLTGESDLPDVMSNFLYIKIQDKDGSVVDAVRLIFSKEYEKCYVQLD